MSSNNVISSINLNSSKQYINSPDNNSKYNNLNKKIKSNKPILLNITSIQSSEQKAIYYKENEKKDQRIKFLEILKENNSSLADSLVKIKINYLLERYGKNKGKELLSLIDNSDNPINIINDEKIIRNIVGEDFKEAQYFLRYLLNCSTIKDNNK